MPIRYYICPVVSEIGITGGLEQRPKILQYCTRLTPGMEQSYSILTDQTGTSVKPWCIAKVKADLAHFDAIDADPECIDLLEKLPDAAGETRQEIIAWLKSHTVGEIPTVRRNRIRNRLTALGIDTSSITLASTFFDVVRLVFRAHEPSNLLEDL